jgi:hypothetical protein
MKTYDQITDQQLDELARQRFGQALLIGIVGACTLFVVGAAVSMLAHH